METGDMSLEIKGRLDGEEIVHYYDKTCMITSRHRQVTVRRQGRSDKIRLPSVQADVFGFSRLARRALRLDKCNVLPVGENAKALVLVRKSRVYFCNLEDGILHQTLTLSNCRQLLHQSIARVGEHELFMGEYGGNPKRCQVPVYRSQDAGRSWETVFKFAAGSIKHIHGCYWDPWWERLWVLTGDFSGECWMLVADRDFKDVQWLGDGEQVWRAVNLFFMEDRVVWLMDSQLEENKLVTYDRRSGDIDVGIGLPGPVWYIKRLHDGRYLAGTACERGPGVKDGYAHLLYSPDLSTWSEVARFAHDGFPRPYFKNGVIGFAEGKQSTEDFVLFGEALHGLDGRAVRARLVQGGSA